MSNRRIHDIFCDGKLICVSTDKSGNVKINVYTIPSSKEEHSKWPKLTACDKYVVNSVFGGLTIRKCGVFKDSESAITKPFVLAYSKQNDSYVVISVAVDNLVQNVHRLNAACCLENRPKEKWLDDSFILLDGMILIWQNTNTLFVGNVSLDRVTFEYHPFEVSEANSKCTGFTILAAAATDKRVIVMIRLNMVPSDETDLFSFSNSNEKDVFVWMMERTEEQQWDRHELDISSFFPSDYAQQITECHLTVHSFDVQKATANNSVVLLLDNGYIILLDNGKLKHFCKVDDSHENAVCDSREWHFIHRFDSKCVFKTSDKEVYVVELNNGKIMQSWSGVCSVTTGDYLRNGRLQMLMIREEDLAGNEISSWFLTDFSGCEIDSSTFTDENTSEDSGWKSAVEALQIHLQSSSMNLCDAEQHLTNKMKFIHHTWQVLQNSAKGLDVTPSKSEVPMVTLRKPKLEENRVREIPGLHLHTDIAWKRVAASCLVIGVDVHNSSNFELTRCHVVLLPKDEMMSSNSKWPTFELLEQISNSEIENSAVKKPKLDDTFSKKNLISLKPKRKLCLTAFTDIDEFDFRDDLKLWVFLIGSQFVTGSEESMVFTQCCGDVTLSSEEYLQAKLAVPKDLSTMSNQEVDIVKSALSTIQTKRELDIMSTISDLRQIQLSLETSLGFTHVPTFNCLCHMTCQPLTLVRLERPYIISRNNVYLSTWTRNETQLQLLVQHLYSNLPDDVIISHHSAEKSNISAAILSVGEEIRALSMAARSTLEKSKGMMGESSVKDIKQTEQVSGFRDKFSKQQMSLQRMEEYQIDPSKVKVIRDLSEQSQINTDKCVAKYIKR